MQSTTTMATEYTRRARGEQAAAAWAEAQAVRDAKAFAVADYLGSACGPLYLEMARRHGADAKQSRRWAASDLRKAARRAS